MKPAKGRQVQDLILTLGYIYFRFIDIDIDIKGLFCDLVGRICLLSALIGINLWQSHETQALSPQGTPCVSRGLYSPPPKCNHSCRIFTTSLIYGHRHTIALNWSWINGSSVPMNISLDNCLIFYILRFEVFAPTIRAFSFWISRVGQDCAFVGVVPGVEALQRGVEARLRCGINGNLIPPCIVTSFQTPN